MLLGWPKIFLKISSFGANSTSLVVQPAESDIWSASTSKFCVVNRVKRRSNDFDFSKSHDQEFVSNPRRILETDLRLFSLCFTYLTDPVEVCRPLLRLTEFILPFLYAAIACQVHSQYRSCKCSHDINFRYWLTHHVDCGSVISPIC